MCHVKTNMLNIKSFTSNSCLQYRKKNAQLIRENSIVIGPVMQKSQRKIEIIFLSISLNMCFGYSKDLSHETVLLSTHNICFG